MNRNRCAHGWRFRAARRNHFVAVLLVPWLTIVAAAQFAYGDEPPPSVTSAIDAELAVQEAAYQHLQGNQTEALQSLESTEDHSTAAIYLRALVLLEGGDCAAAASLLETVYARNDAPDETPLYLGLALLHQGNSSGAEAVLNSFVAERPDHQYANYLLGVALARQDRLEEADQKLASAGVVGGAAQFRLASHAQQLAGVDVAGDPCAVCDPCDCECLDPDSVCNPQRQLHITIINAIDYDTNVPSTPDFTGLGANFNEQEDARYTLAMFGDWLLVNRPNWNAGLIFSTFDSWHFDSSRFNIQDYMGGVYTNVGLGPYWMGGMRYEYHETLLGNDHLASEHRVTPNLTFLGFSGGHTTMYYEYDTALSNAPALIPQQIQSGNVNSVGVTQAFYTYGGDGRIYLGYRYENADADGDEFDRFSHMLTARTERPMYALDAIWDAEVRHFWDDYANPNSLDFLRRTREDTRVEVRSGIQRNLNDYWAMRFDYTYLWRNSNVENLFGVGFFDYDRHILSTQLIYDF